MIHFLCELLPVVLVVTLASCGKAGQDPSFTIDQSTPAQSILQSSHSTSSEIPEGNMENSSETAITLTVGDQAFTATLSDNDTARELVNLLPLTLDMSELNGNEKYFFLSSSLPTDSQRPGQINAGDLMLYGDNCIVLFYKSFSSGYSYTPLGHVDDPTGLADALGAGNVTITFAGRE